MVKINDIVMLSIFIGFSVLFFTFLVYIQQTDFDNRQKYCEQFELDYDSMNDMCVCDGYGVQYGHPPPTENYLDFCEDEEGFNGHR